MGEIIADLHDHGIGYASNSLSSLAAKMEIKACEMSVDKNRFSVSRWIFIFSIYDTAKKIIIAYN